MTGWKTAAYLILTALLAFLPMACTSEAPSGAPPSVAKPAIDYPQNQKIFFNDGENRHVISLFDDGSYLFKTGDASGLVTGTRNGMWRWKRSGTHEALLTLDQDQWKLTFVSPDDAIAVNLSAAGRSHIFNFEPL